MNKYNDLEISILSCLLQKPELMKETILEDKYFVKYKKLWLFMKAFYNKFGNFDLTLMLSVVDNKYKYVDYIYWLLDVEPTASRFKEYEKQIIDLFNEGQKEKWIINKIYQLSNELYVRSITVEQFKNKSNQVYMDAEKLFEKNK